MQPAKCFKCLMSTMAAHAESKATITGLCFWWWNVCMMHLGIDAIATTEVWCGIGRANLLLTSKRKYDASGVDFTCLPLPSPCPCCSQLLDDLSPTDYVFASVGAKTVVAAICQRASCLTIFKTHFLIQPPTHFRTCTYCFVTIGDAAAPSGGGFACSACSLLYPQEE